jgi:NH3-dependent NAD+ synthetase
MLAKFQLDVESWLGARSFFVAEDFRVSYHKENNRDRDRMLIEYRHADASAFFEATIPRKREKTSLLIAWKCAPGEVGTEENGVVSGTIDLREQVWQWLGWFADELRARPAARLAAETKKATEEFAQRLENLEDGMFTAAEGEELKKRLSELEAKMAEQIEKSGLEKKELDRQIRALHDDILALKEQVTVRSKKSWAASAMSRFKRFWSDPDNRKLTTTIVETTVKMLGDGKHH